MSLNFTSSPLNVKFINKRAEKSSERVRKNYLSTISQVETGEFSVKVVDGVCLELFKTQQHVELIVFHYDFLNRPPDLFMLYNERVITGTWVEWITTLGEQIRLATDQLKWSVKINDPVTTGKTGDKADIYVNPLVYYRQILVRVGNGESLTVPHIAIDSSLLITDLTVLLTHFESFESFERHVRAVKSLKLEAITWGADPSMACEKVYTREGLVTMPADQIDLQQVVKIGGHCWQSSYLAELLATGERVDEFPKSQLQVTSRQKPDIADCRRPTLYNEICRARVREIIEQRQVYYPLSHYDGKHRQIFNSLSLEVQGLIRSYVSGNLMNTTVAPHHNINRLNAQQVKTALELSRLITTIPPIYAKKAAFRGVKMTSATETLFHPIPFSTSLKRSTSLGFAGGCCLYRFDLEGLRGLIIGEVPEQALQHGERSGAVPSGPGPGYAQEYEIIMAPGVSHLVSRHRGDGGEELVMGINQYIDVFQLKASDRSYYWFTRGTEAANEFIRGLLTGADNLVQVIKAGEFWNRTVTAEDIQKYLQPPEITRQPEPLPKQATIVVEGVTLTQDQYQQALGGIRKFDLNHLQLIFKPKGKISSEERDIRNPLVCQIRELVPEGWVDAKLPETEREATLSRLRKALVKQVLDR